MNALTKRIVDVARGYVGVREEGGNNRGAAVEAILARVGGHPGEAWCAATAWCIVWDACESLGLESPLAPTRSAHRLIKNAPEVCRCGSPVPGAIAGHDSGGGKGHVGIVVEIDGAGRLLTIEGNTDADGSREGQEIAYRWRPAGYWDLGFVDVSAALA